MRKSTRLDAIVTVVDAKHVLHRLRGAHEAQEQIAFAHIIILNKTDLVVHEELLAVKSRIRAMNPTALIYETDRG